MPPGVSGSSGSTTIAAGTMYSGSRAAACSRAASASTPGMPILAVADGGGQVGGQPSVSRHVFPDRHRCPGDTRAGGQYRLDLAGLDPEPADLDLIISPPGEDQLPVRRPPGHVPGPVHPLPRPPERARGEPLGGQPGAVPGSRGPVLPRRCTTPRSPRPGPGPATRPARRLRVLATGVPIGGGPDPCSGPVIAAHTVASVGP